MTSFVVVCSIVVAATTGSSVTAQKTVTARSVAVCQNSGKVNHWIQFQLPLYQNRYEAICGPDGIDCIHLEPRA